MLFRYSLIRKVEISATSTSSSEAEVVSKGSIGVDVSAGIEVGAVGSKLII